MSATVYIAVNRHNGHMYVGVTSKTVEDRERRHWRSVRGGSQTKFHNALRKYGREGVGFFAIHECSNIQQAYAKEREMIAQHKAEYNMTEGGDGVIGLPRSEAWRRRQSEMMRGNAFAKGWHPNAEQLAKMAKARIGNQHLKGHKHSEEAKRKMSIAHVGNKNALGYRHTEETKRRISASLRRKAAKRRTRR